MSVGSVFKSRATLMALVAAVVVTVASTASSLFRRPPLLNVITPHVSLGRVELKDQPLQFRFALHNAGGSDLVIHAVRPSCGCATIQMSTNRISAGGEGVLIATVIPDRKGWGSVSITLSTNDPENMAYRLEADWDGFSSLRLTPPVLEFGAVPSGVKVTQSVTIDGPPGSEVNRVSSSCAELVAELAKGELRITLTAERPLGRKHGVVTVDSNRGPLEVPATWNVQGDFDVAPNLLMLSPRGNGASHGGIEIIAHKDGLDVHWEWSRPIPGVAISLEELTARSWRMTASTTGSHNRLSRGEITLKGGGDVLTIPVTMILTSPSQN